MQYFSSEQNVHETSSALQTVGSCCCWPSRLSLNDRKHESRPANCFDWEAFRQAVFLFLALSPNTHHTASAFKANHGGATRTFESQVPHLNHPGKGERGKISLMEPPAKEVMFYLVWSLRVERALTSASGPLSFSLSLSLD